MRRLALLSTGAALLACHATPAGAAAGPALETSRTALLAAVACSGDVATAARAPVLLVHGTGVSARENWDSTYGPELTRRGHGTARPIAAGAAGGSRSSGASAEGCVPGVPPDPRRRGVPHRAAPSRGPRRHLVHGDRDARRRDRDAAVTVPASTCAGRRRASRRFVIDVLTRPAAFTAYAVERRIGLTLRD